MYILLAIAVILAVAVVVLIDRARQAIREGRRRRNAAIRLAVAAATAEEKARKQSAAAEVTNALTTVLPAIPKEERGPRHVA